MKPIFLITLVLLFILSCKKEINNTVAIDQYISKVKEALADSMSAADFQKLDFGRAVLNRVDSVNLYVARIPFKTKPVSEDFVVVKTDREGRVQRGRIVHMELTEAADSTTSNRYRKINGVLIMRSLQGKEEVRSPIENGYVTAFHQQAMQRTSVELAPGMLPEVVIIGVRHLEGGISFSTWCMVQTFFMDFGGGDSWGGYYGSLDGDGGSSGGGGGPVGGGGYNSGGAMLDETVQIDIENQDDRTAIDIEKFINCFNAIPDAGAICSVEIMADIPVDSDPNKIFDFASKSPGHTFLNIRKSNATQSVSQNIGFYPKSGFKTILTNAPIDGKFVDNGNHEFNAGFIQNITPEQLHHVLIKMQQDKNMKYDIDNFNCTDWALDVFNAAGAFQLDVPLYDIPGNYPSSGTHMPNGVYNKIREIKTTNPAQAGNTDMNFLKAYSGNSTGPCN